MRADKKSSVKKAREKADRITMRGVRIAASSEPKASCVRFVRLCMLYSCFCCVVSLFELQAQLILR